MTSTLQPTAPAGAGWLTLKQARTLLGVNANSLRTWADRGVVRSFRTPGGHRRFAETDLLALTHNATHSNGSRPGLSDQTVARIRRKLVTGPAAHHAPWLDLLPDVEREELRTLGRRLVALAADYLATAKGRAALNAQARTIGERYGAILGQRGLAFSQMLEGFLFFRNQIEEMAQRAPKPNGQASANGSAHRTLNSLLDQVLLGTVRGYESQAKPIAPTAVRVRRQRK